MPMQKYSVNQGLPNPLFDTVRGGKGMNPRTALIIVLFLLSGCEPRGMLTPQILPTSKLSNYKTIALDVSAPTTEAAEVVLPLKERLIAKFHQAGLQTVVRDSGADVRLKVNIVEAKTVSTGTRLLLWPFVGRARIVVNGEMLDGKANTPIGTFRAEGESARAGSIFNLSDVTTDGAIDQVVKQIVTFLSQQR